ncbi:MAG: hypothetical protein QNJ57_04700 [Flavobacteriaceae bacterium]|nr:hypothetical protein [Flavobacteriaceae bacterium]
MSKDFIFSEIIKAYRSIIEERYAYDTLVQKYVLPASFDEAHITEVRTYFLTYMYPELSKRKELNEAFESLDRYIKNPSKLLQIIVDSVALILKYGRHLPKILNSGIKALRSFREASEFEKRLMEEAIKSEQEPPFSTETIYSFIRALPREDIDQFINGTRSLFEILHDRNQVKKIIEIVAYLITKMKKNQKSYSKEEIKGLEIGHELIKEGDALFEKLGKENQEQLIDFITYIEISVLDEIYS